MSYSIDYRKRVMSFVKEGGSKREAARLFKLSPNTVYQWLQRGTDLKPRVATVRRRKLDKKVLMQHVQQNPDATLRERAAHFGVTVNAIWVAKKRLRIVKKTTALHRKMSYEKNGVSARAAPFVADLRRR
jgi:putative transposase